MAKYLIGILLLGMMACKSQPKSERDPLREMIQGMCRPASDAYIISSHTAEIRATIKAVSDQQEVIRKVIAEYEAMSGELLAIHNPKVAKIMSPHLNQALRLENQANEIARRE